MRRLLSITFALAATLLFVACDGGSEGETPEATASPTDVATTPVGDTGAPGVDAVLAAVEAADASALAALFAFQDVACTDQPGPGQPPPCRTAGPPGTLVSVFPVTSCDLGWTSEAEPLVAHLLDASPALHSVVRYGDPERYDVVYVAPFERDPGLVEVLRLTVEGNAVVSFDEGCGPVDASAAIDNADGEVILTGPAAEG